MPLLDPRSSTPHMRLRRYAGWVVCLLTSLTILLLCVRHQLQVDPFQLELQDDTRDIRNGGWRLRKFHPVARIARGQTSTPPEDELVNLRPFRFFTADRSKCSRGGPHLLALVHSSPNHFLHRSMVRRTWASVKNHRNCTIRVVFLLGDPLDRRIQSHLDDEIQTYGDIVQGSFVDSYRNLTYKHVMGYKWVTQYCPTAKMVLKVDDDIFVDIFRVVTVLLDNFSQSPSGVLACCVVSEGTIPQQTGKWAVTEDEFRFDTYPEYCSGMAYFVTPDLVRDIYTATRYVPFFWIDDVYVTGCVVDALRLKRTSINVWYTHNETGLLHWLGRGRKPSSWMFGEVAPRNWADTMERLWAKTVQEWRKEVT